MFPELDEMDLSDSPTIDSLRLVIGEEALGQLSADFGGSQVSIPAKPGEHSPIAVSIGLYAAQRLAYVWGGMSMSVPVNAGKQALIRQMLENGIPKNQIARTLNVSRWLIYQVESGESRKNQLDLFAGPSPL